MAYWERMELLVFIVVLVALILVHEFGHFVAAKLSGMRVDEFGIGFPPRALRLGKRGETEYTLNWLPLGGFVKIYGEDGAGSADPRSFVMRPRILQAFTLVAGVAMNLFFAYVLITAALVAGTPRALSADEAARATHVQLAVADVLPGSPAAPAGIQPGDIIARAMVGDASFDGTSSADFSAFVAKDVAGAPVTLSVEHADGSMGSVTVIPATGLIPSDPSRKALGVEVSTIGVISEALGPALIDGAVLAWGATKLTAIGLAQFFAGVFTLHANLSQVAGPIGIAGAVGAASSAGFGNLLSLMAVISINLALINLIPIPALDGGRLLFVLIEAVTRRPIKPVVAQAFNMVGFALILLLMAVVSVHDIFRIVS
ncbi:MAG TPA: M50 family metallopeptidase [Candidatus Paceibacterota bacterium]|nr:M50 family metallopeptidase [Candidatus Paceibacterota bacterium]